MQIETSAESSEEPPSSNSFNSLKQFKSAGRGFWADVPEADWSDWKWQLKHRITTVEQLQRLMPTLTPDEYAGAALANTKLALAITPYFFNLIDPTDENCPIRSQVIPRLQETTTAPFGKWPTLAAKIPIHRCRDWCIAIRTACFSWSPIAVPLIAVIAPVRAW